MHLSADQNREPGSERAGPPSFKQKVPISDGSIAHILHPLSHPANNTFFQSRGTIHLPDEVVVGIDSTAAEETGEILQMIETVIDDFSNLGIPGITLSVASSQRFKSSQAEVLISSGAQLSTPRSTGRVFHPRSYKNP